MGKRFFIVCETYKNTGVERKIEAQKKALKKRGRFEPLLESPSSPYQRLYKAQRTIIQKAKEAELVYYRYSALNWLLHRFLIKKMKGRYFLEINALNGPELKWEKGLKGITKRYMNSFYEKRLFRSAKTVLAVSPSITQYVRSYYPHVDIKIIDNGYEKREIIAEGDHVIAEKIYNWKKKNYLVGLFAGTFFPWAGVDRIIDWIADHPETALVLAGFGPEEKRILHHISGPLRERILFTGKRKETELVFLYEHCDFAFSSMAIERKELSEARSLKTREYLAYGLPVICNHQESPTLEKSGLLLPANIPVSRIREICGAESKEERAARLLPLLSWDRIYEKLGDW